jgi:hypothetical protein
MIVHIVDGDILRAWHNDLLAFMPSPVNPDEDVFIYLVEMNNVFTYGGESQCSREV